MSEELNIAENTENTEEKLQEPQEVVNSTSENKEFVESEVIVPSEDIKVEETEKLEKSVHAEQRMPVKERSLSKPDESFNWDEIGKDVQIYSETELKHLDDIYSQTFKSIIEQEVVDGTVVAKTPRK